MQIANVSRCYVDYCTYSLMTLYNVDIERSIERLQLVGSRGVDELSEVLSYLYFLIKIREKSMQVREALSIYKVLDSRGCDSSLSIYV